MWEVRATPLNCLCKHGGRGGKEGVEDEKKKRVEREEPRGLNLSAHYPGRDGGNSSKKNVTLRAFSPAFSFSLKGGWLVGG